MQDYILQRSKRKTISLSVNENGDIIVKAPYFVHQKIIENFILEKQDWLKKQVEKNAENKEKKSRFWKDYSRFLFLGNYYNVIFGNFKKTSFDGRNIFTPKSISQEKFKSDLIKIYKTEAKKIILKIADKLYLETGLYGESIKINGAKKRWGSCSGKNSLNFSFFLVMADIKAVEYVVLHELCHTVHHDHSKRFWGLVGKYMPDYKIRQNMLLQLQKKLAEQDW